MQKKANHTTNQHRSVWELSLCQCFPGLSFTSIWYLQNTWTLKNICEMLVRCQFYKFVGERHSTEIWWGQILYWAPNKYWVQTEPWHLSRPPNLWSLHFKREKYMTSIVPILAAVILNPLTCDPLSKTCLAKCNGKCSASRIFPPSNWTNRWTGISEVSEYQKYQKYQENQKYREYQEKTCCLCDFRWWWRYQIGNIWNLSVTHKTLRGKKHICWCIGNSNICKINICFASTCNVWSRSKQCLGDLKDIWKYLFCTQAGVLELSPVNPWSQPCFLYLSFPASCQSSENLICNDLAK